MARLPFNVQVRTLATRRAGVPSYIAWNAAGAVFNVRQDAASRLWRASAQRFPHLLQAHSLAKLAAALDLDTTSEPALTAPAGASEPVRELYLSWQDNGREDRAAWSGLS